MKEGEAIVAVGGWACGRVGVLQFGGRSGCWGDGVESSMYSCGIFLFSGVGRVAALTFNRFCSISPPAVAAAPAAAAATAASVVVRDRIEA